MVEVGTIVEMVKRLELTPGGAVIDPEASFSDNGIDSLDVMTLMLAVEESFGTKFTDSEAGAIRSIADLALTLNRRLSAPPK